MVLESLNILTSHLKHPNIGAEIGNRFSVALALNGFVSFAAVINLVLFSSISIAVALTHILTG